MDDALLVRRFEGLCDLLRDRQRFVERDRPARDALREILTLDELHHERADAAGFFEAVNVRNRWMVQRRERLRLACEPGESFGVASKFVWQDFERDVTIQFRIASAVDLPHPALADMRNDFVDAEPGAGCEGQVLRIIWGQGRP